MSVQWYDAEAIEHDWVFPAVGGAAVIQRCKRVSPIPVHPSCFCNYGKPPQNGSGSVTTTNHSGKCPCLTFPPITSLTPHHPHRPPVASLVRSIRQFVKVAQEASTEIESNRMGEKDKRQVYFPASYQGIKRALLIPPPASGIARGPLLPPQNRRTMNSMDFSETMHHAIPNQHSRSVPARSNLTTLMQQREEERQRRATGSQEASGRDSLSQQDSSLGIDSLHESESQSESQRQERDLHPVPQHQHSEADSASGPCITAAAPARRPSRAHRGHSAPTVADNAVAPNVSSALPPEFLPQSAESSAASHRSMENSTTRRSTGTLEQLSGSSTDRDMELRRPLRSSEGPMRRCMSSKELGVLMGRPSLSTSPYAYMLYQRDILEARMQERLEASRGVASPRDRSCSPSPVVSGETAEEGDCVNRKDRLLKNQKRNRRRAEHTKAVINDLCEIVTDLFVAESKLLNPSKYGVDPSLHQEEVFRSVQQFVSALPNRYALGVDTPSEVLLHMRLMSVTRSDNTRAAVHIVNLQEGSKTGRPLRRVPNRALRLVTVACADTGNLLEYMTKLLSTGGSRVLDADVMTSRDGIVLDRYVVEMNGRLRLDKLANYVESFLAQAREQETNRADVANVDFSSDLSGDDSPRALKGESPVIPGPVYFHPPSQNNQDVSPKEIQEEIQSAVPLSEVLASDSSAALEHIGLPGNHSSPHMRRQLSAPPLSAPIYVRKASFGSRKSSMSCQGVRLPHNENTSEENSQPNSQPMHQRRPLVNREATNFRDDVEQHRDFLLVAPPSLEHSPGVFADVEGRQIPLVPFEELMLIETLGMGRVSTIYRAAWKQGTSFDGDGMPKAVDMVALKVATVNPDTGDTSHVEELRREADIAALLKHSNICDIVGVAADAECFCIAYEFCEGGSLLSLLSDTSRYYEYLPIALDIANGMAYLHSRNVIHRDLKPSNVLLSRDHRGKIADFGMSVAMTGQELTAETGTYRYMAPEVIRHESYSSNADVYSFGIVLWQLIAREVPFATMTPIQAAFAVAGGQRPDIPPSTPPRLRELIEACWDQDSHKRPSFTYIAMALADYARMAFSPANVGTQTLHIANEMLANVVGESNVNVDPSVAMGGRSSSAGEFRAPWIGRQSSGGTNYSFNSNVGLEI